MTLQRVLTLSGECIALAGGAFLIGTLVYAMVSFALMRPYVTARALNVSVRYLVREVFLAALVQPLLPLYYVLGRRMGPRLRRESPRRFVSAVPVVFVHGYMQNRASFVGLARALARKRVGPLYAINYPWFASIASNAERLERFVAAVCLENKSVAVDLVCHSMGGLVAMETVRVQAKQESCKIRRVVAIATPYGGVMWRGPLFGVGAASLRHGSKFLEAQAGLALKLPTLSIFSNDDNVVYPKQASSLAKRGGIDLEVDGLSHLAILFAPVVAEHVAAFLLESDDALPASVVVPSEPEAEEAAADATLAHSERHAPASQVAASNAPRR